MVRKARPPYPSMDARAADIIEMGGSQPHKNLPYGIDPRHHRKRVDYGDM